MKISSAFCEGGTRKIFKFEIDINLRVGLRKENPIAPLRRFIDYSDMLFIISSTGGVLLNYMNLSYCPAYEISPM